MKKLIVLLSLVSLTFGQMAFQEGDNVAGVAFNLGYGGGIGIGAAWDRGAINNMFSFGVEAKVAFDHYDETWYGGRQDWTSTYIAPEFRFAFHPFGLPALQGKVKAADELNPYVLLHTGPVFHIWSWDYDGPYLDGYNDHDSDLDVGGTFALGLGVRWFFKPNFGLWSELDWDRFFAGVAFKF